MPNQEPLSAAELAEMKRLEEAATPGPWIWIDTQAYCDPVDGPDKNALVGQPRDPNAKPYPTDSSERVLDFELPIENIVNANFIAASRSFVPRALAMIEGLQADEQELRNESFEDRAFYEVDLEKAVAERDQLRAEVERLKADIAATIFGNCACITDMPGDSYCCTHHQRLRQIGREAIDAAIQKETSPTTPTPTSSHSPDSPPEPA